MRLRDLFSDDATIDPRAEAAEVTGIAMDSRIVKPGDVFFALAGKNGAGCLIPHDAAVRVKLLEELQARFPDLSNDMIIKAMACTSNKSFLVWKSSDGSVD